MLDLQVDVSMTTTIGCNSASINIPFLYLHFAVPKQKVSPLDCVTPRFYHGILRETTRNCEGQREMVRNRKKWWELMWYHGSKRARVPRYLMYAVLV